MSLHVSNQSRVAFSELRAGDLFQLEHNGVVFIRCRGGFRNGRGGQLHACLERVLVARYRAHDVEPSIETGREVQS